MDSPCSQNDWNASRQSLPGVEEVYMCIPTFREPGPDGDLRIDDLELGSESGGILSYAEHGKKRRRVGICQEVSKTIVKKCLHRSRKGISIRSRPFDFKRFEKCDSSF